MVGLYPALVKEWIRKILMIMFLRTEVKVKQVDWKEVGVYLAMTHSQQELDQEGLGEVVPRWRYRPQGGGNRPGITSSRAQLGKVVVEEEESRRRKRRRGDDEQQGEEESWLEPDRCPSEEERKTMLAMAVVAGVMGAMDNHIYRFNRQTRRQQDGGSIGSQVRWRTW